MLNYFKTFIVALLIVIFQFPLTSYSQSSLEINQTAQTNANVDLGDSDWSTIDVLELKKSLQITLDRTPYTEAVQARLNKAEEPTSQDSTTYMPRLNDNAGASHWWLSEIDYQEDKAYLNLFYPNVTLDNPYDTYGWNGLDEFDALQTSAGLLFFRSPYLPEPDFASPHSAEVVIGIHGVSTAGEGRDVGRDPFMASGLIGINYLYNEHFGVHFNFQGTTNLLDGEHVRDPLIGQDEIPADVSYGAFMMDVYF